VPRRTDNSVDFWRGLALIVIFINHVPGIVYERFTQRNYGLSDSAELFVFLAGWSLRGLAANRDDPLTMQRMILRVGGRAVVIYGAQIVITMLAIGLLAGVALGMDNPLLLEWHNASAVFHDPVRAHIGLVLLTHQLGYFNILPLYVALMVGAVGLAICHRLAPRLVLPLSVALYLWAISMPFNFRMWPVDDGWFFNPLCWQLIFVLGFLLAADEGPGAFVRRHAGLLRLSGLVVVLLGLGATQLHYAPDPLSVPQPVLLFVFDKTYLSPARLLHALGLYALLAGSFPLFSPYIPRLTAYFCLLGRNGLYVFCVGSIASLAGQIARFVFGGSLAVDTVILGLGLVVLGLTAWLCELRDRLRAAA